MIRFNGIAFLDIKTETIVTLRNSPALLRNDSCGESPPREGAELLACRPAEAEAASTLLFGYICRRLAVA